MSLIDRIKQWEDDKFSYHKKFINNPYLIAEIGVNHESDLQTAKNLCLEAKESGANAAKFQTYKAESIASKEAKAYWDLNENSITSQKELFKKYDSFSKKEYFELAKYCNEIEIDFMSTPFDTECLTWLNEIVNVFKISSSDLTNKILISQIAKLNKNIILSTGASNLNEIKTALEWISNETNKTVVLNHCILNYPTQIEDANLMRILELANKFPNTIIGYSDHTKPTQDLSILQEASLLGASVIEKHFTNDKNLKGNDHFHSMDKHDISNFREAMKKREVLYGEYEIRPLESEEISRSMARRSLVLNKTLLSGTVLKKEHLTAKRPGTGISPAEIENVLGKSLNKDKEEDTVLKFEDIN